MINLSFDFDLFNNYYYFYERLFVLLFALVPSILLVWFVLRTDRKNKEPKKNIIICLLSGILTISLSSYLEGMVQPYFSNNMLLTYVWATIEELSKIAIFFLFIFDNKHYDDIYDGLVYMTLIALSFAGLENIMYAFSESTISQSISLALMRDLTTIPLHVICGIVIGFFMSVGNFSKDKYQKYINFALAIIIPSLIHGTYNNLMSILGNINVGENALLILLFKALPLLFIMIGLYIIAFRFSKKTLELNSIYVNNKKYDKKYNYLMIKDEYNKSDAYKNRIIFYEKTSLKKHSKRDDE